MNCKEILKKKWNYISKKQMKDLGTLKKKVRKINGKGKIRNISEIRAGNIEKDFYKINY